MSPEALVARFGLPVGGALFDAAGPLTGGIHRYAALCLDPVETLSWRLGDPGDPFELLAELHGRARRPGEVAHPRPLVACALGYDLGRVVERLPSTAHADGHLPDLWAARYSRALVWDRLEQRAIHVGDGWRDPVGATPAFSVGLDPQPEMSRDAYLDALARIRGHIAAGDVYQVNYTVRFSAPFEGDASALFTRMRARSPVPFGALLRPAADQAVLSTSPERFLAWDAAGHVETRPIKGTRPRSADPVQDARAVAELRASAKDAAEHVMVVDLERNDLGRVCRPGSVEVSRLLAPEAYATVHHLVSTVRGRLRPDARLPDLLRATFPGGSITGAPKVRAMQIIEALEPVRRGIYCGAVGYLDASGAGDLNIAIRTAWQAGGRLYYQAGGGIVADSDPATEWEEVGWKARAFLDACRRE